jgi:hypothetical protein
MVATTPKITFENVVENAEKPFQSPTEWAVIVAGMFHFFTNLPKYSQ